MFCKTLSTTLLRKMNEKELTQESLAEICNMSERAVGNIIRGHAVPRLDSFEKICAGLEVSPEDLLLDKKSRDTNKLIAMKVTHIKCMKQADTKEYVNTENERCVAADSRLCVFRCVASAAHFFIFLGGVRNEMSKMRDRTRFEILPPMWEKTKGPMPTGRKIIGILIVVIGGSGLFNCCT